MSKILYNTLSRYQANMLPQTHMVICLVDADEEEQLSDEEVNAEVLVDGVAVGLQASQEAESGYADG